MPPPSSSSSSQQHHQSPAYTDPTYQSTHSTLFHDSITTPLVPVLPPGISRATFDAALARYKGVVGAEQVYHGAEQLAEYIDPYELHEQDAGARKVPSAAVRPKNEEELRGVLRVSGEFGIPVWTFSRGKNLGCVPLFFSFFFLFLDVDVFIS
jgi:hypothetical protein